MTGETEARLPLETGRLLDWLAGEGLVAGGPLAVRQFSGGQSNPTYRLETPDRTLVLRRKPPGPLLPRAHMIEREHRVMAALAATPVPVPAMLGFCADEGVIGSAFYVMAHVEGRVLHDPALPGLAAAERTAIHHALVDTLAALHGVDTAASGLSDFGREGGYLARQVRTWGRAYAASATETIPEMDRLGPWLETAVARVPDETCLVHGDYRIDNAMLAPEGPRVVAVLDWELSTLGHPLADLGYHLMTWRFPAGLRHGLAETDLAALGVPTAEALAARYAAATGRKAIPEMDLLIALNAWKMAAIIQGVHARGLAGNAADPAAVTMGADVARLARVAWEHAVRAGA